MGCAPSQPLESSNPRTDTVEVWDEDFKPKSLRPTINPQIVGHLGPAREPNVDIPFTLPGGMSSSQIGRPMKLPTQSAIPQDFSPQNPFSSNIITNTTRTQQHPPRGKQTELSGNSILGGDLTGYNVNPRSKHHLTPTNAIPPNAINRPVAPGHPSETEVIPDARIRGRIDPLPVKKPSREPHRPPQPERGNRSFGDYYISGHDLGKGAFAKVFVGIERVTRHEYAVKQIDRSKMRWNGRDALQDEIGNLTKLRNAPNIVYLHECFLEEKLCYMVLELLPGKALFQRLIQKGTFTEEEARNSCRCVLYALAYMHERRMTHRDLKPDNLLLADELDTDKVKLADFGFSKTLATRNACRTLCGTPGFLAPEILERWPAYDVKCDTWSFGVILFVLLGGYLPFDARGSNDTKEVFERTRNGQYHFFPQRWQGISQMAKDLIAKCLTVNPNTRISTQAALSHPWMDGGLLLSNTIISAASLAGTINEFTRPRNEKEREQRVDRDVDRLKELNDDFTVFLAGREGDSIVSAMTGAGRTVGGETAVSHSFQEDSLTGKPFLHFYIKQTQLGQGSFGTVFRCVHQRTGLTYAVKQVETTKSTKAEAATLRDEITALKYLRGAPHIIRLYDVFVEGHVTYLILEEMKGGDLLHRIVEKEVYTEREARDVCKALFSAVNFCHKKQIAHRDIKLENLLLQEADNDSSIKLADFGFAKKVKRGKCLKTMLGTLSFMAPEILNLRSEGYDERCDLWSVGVVVYALLGGYLPFEGNIKEAVMRGEYRFHDEYWRDISLPAKKLITSLLQVDPNHRISMEQSLGARWMTIDDAELSVVDLSMTKSRIQHMVTAKAQLKNAVRVVIGTNRFKETTDVRPSKDGNPVPLSAQAPMDALNSMDALEESDSDGDIDVTFWDVYEMGHPAGLGYLAKIYEATNLVSGKEYSVKKVIRKELYPSDFAALSDELAVLQEVSKGGNTHTICLYEVYEDPDATYMVMEKIQGEILIDKLLQKKKYTEYDAKELVRNLLQGVNHCHRMKIAIRNLTLDNLILRNDSDSDIIITDFEIAKKVLHRNALKTQCGTQEFVAPEVLENRPAYDVSCDMWTVGVIVFILLGGYYPFRGKTEAEMLKNVRYGNYKFRDKFWNGVSADAISLLKSMMTVDPDERLTSEAALQDRWITMDRSVLSNDLTGNVAEIKKEVTRKFRTVVKTVVATQRLEKQSRFL